MNNFLLSNFCSQLKNAFLVKKLYIIIKRSNLIINILNLLYKEGYIKGYKYDGLYNIKIFLKYYKDQSIINNIILISKPSKRIFSSSNLILKQYNLNNLVIISTSKGLTTNRFIFKNYIELNINLNYNFFINIKKYNLYQIESIFFNNKIKLNFIIKNFNSYNLLNRLYFYINNKNIINYINLKSIYNYYIKYDFFKNYKKVILYFFKLLNYKKNLKKYIAYYIIKYKKLVKFNFLNKINYLILIYNLNFTNFLINNDNLNNLNYKLKKKNIKLNKNYHKPLNKKINMGGEIILLIN